MHTTHWCCLFLSEPSIFENSCVNFFQSGLVSLVDLKTIFSCTIKCGLDERCTSMCPTLVEWCIY